MKPSIYSLTRQEMIEWAEDQGEKKFRAAQISGLRQRSASGITSVDRKSVV